MSKKRIKVQDFIPVRDIRDGIVELNDNRFIKILEIEPINFMLRSEEEQAGIIASFGAWLKIAPVRLQFKSMTRRADADRHVEAFRRDVLHEENGKCRQLAEGYVRLIREAGNMGALTRRFFLIFEYEARIGDTLERVVGTMRTAEQTARAYFSQCGNEILQPQDPNEAAVEILYTFFNRRTSEEEPLCDHINRVLLQRTVAKGQVFGRDPIPDVPVVDLIAPADIELTHVNHIVMDGRYFSFLFIKGDGFPGTVKGGWLSALVNAGEGIDIDVFLVRENRSKTVDKVAQRIRLNRTKLKGKQDTSTDFEELANSISAGYYIKRGIAGGNEDLFYLSVFITVSAKSLKELIWRRQQFTDMLRSMDIFVSDCRFEQEAALRTVMPFVQISPSLERKSKRNVLTGGAASTYLPTSFELSDEHGVLLGVNQYNNSLCIIDLFDTKKNKNANMNLIGTSGTGKTFTMQLLALRMRMRGVQCYTLAPIKGHEFRRACNQIGGSFIRIAPGSPSCINLMEIRHTVTPVAELIDGESASEETSMLAQKIQQLMIFFSLLIPDITIEEEQLLDECLIKTYAKFGITHDNGSLYEDKTALKMKPMPILGDLHEQLKMNPRAERLAIILSRFVTGSARSFNQQTNVDLTNKYIVFDLSELKGKLLPIGMMIALDFVWDNIKSDRTKRKAVLIDEIWQLIGASSNKAAAEFCLTIFKTIRGFGGAAIAATQDLSDFFGLEDGKYGRAIINNSQNKIILGLEPDEAKYVQEVLKLTPSEIRAVTRFERGEALVCSNCSKVPVVIKASLEEQEMITTDRAELENLLRKKQTEAEAP